MSRLSDDARAIWQAGVSAVDSGRLIRAHVRRDAETLTVAGNEFTISKLERIVVVGAGKAGAGMARALEEVLGPDLLERTSGWVNVPADCVAALDAIHLHTARPAGVNEPTEDGVAGARKILELVRGLGANDLCLVLLSGGGSALLPAPVPEISLADKQTVTRALMQGGATIDELNCVRKQLSEVKGGNLARAAPAGTMVALIISDVIGDPLDVIASGPTVPDTNTPAEALEILARVRDRGASIPESVVAYLKERAAHSPQPPPVRATVKNAIIGNNAVALSAAAEKAEELGYTVHSLGSDNAGVAREAGVALAELCRLIRDSQTPLAPPACVLSGGEPIVHLAPTDQPRKGGRNQELVLAGLQALGDDIQDIVLLSGGTDGEDGPTDAAGAWADAEVLARARQRNLDPQPFLEINNSYPFFAEIGSLLLTGPTHTNVMDLRVGVVRMRFEGRDL
jgi:glycerate-2-kinase